MNSFNNEIYDLLDGNTPRAKWRYLKDLISENARAKGRLDYCKRHLEILINNETIDPFTKGWIKAVIEQLETKL